MSLKSVFHRGRGNPIYCRQPDMEPELTMTRTFLAALIFTFLTSAGVDADDNWHRFRGPDGNGVASESATPPVEWNGDSDNLKWKTEIPGRGSSSPIVWEDRIILLTAVSTGVDAEGNEVEQAPGGDARPQRGGPGGRRGGPGGRRGGRGGGGGPKDVHEFHVVCVDRGSGEISWKTKVNEAVPHESGHSTNTFASSSAVTDGKHIYVSFGSFGVYCLDMEGNKVWERDLGQMTTRNQFGEGASPALHGNTVVINWDHEGDSFIVAMNAETGEDIWREDRDELTSWSTPVIVEHGDKVQVITNGATRVRSYDLENGEVIWECGGQTGNPIPTPFILDDMAICMTGFRANAAFAIPLSCEGDVTDSNEIVWSRRDIGPYVPTGVLYKGHIYSTKSSSAILTSVDAETGETVIDQTRIDGIDSLYASLVAANDHIYITGRNGTTIVLKHSDEYDVVASNDLGEPCDATPAIVGNQILLRGSNHLFCFENE